MKRKINTVLMMVICLSMILQGSPVGAAGGGKADGGNENETTHTTKYTVKKVKVPPFCITINGSEYEDLSSGDPIIAGSTKMLHVIGRREEKEVGGEWKFFVTFYVDAQALAVPEELEGSIYLGLMAELEGEATGVMKDLAEERKKEEEEKKNEWKPVFPSKSPTPKPTPIHTDPEYIRNYKSPPRTLYKCEFDVNLSGSIQNIGPYTVYGKIGIKDQWSIIEENFLDANSDIEDTGKVTITVDSANNAIAYIEIKGKKYGPFNGVFTCEEDLDIQRKDSGTWPIWGVWTDRNPYQPMPDVEKDFETVQSQIKSGQTPKKINYPEGRWVLLDKGSKDDPRSYATLEVSAEDITFETGEIWPYPGSALFKPKYKRVFSKDLTEEIATFYPPEYDLVIRYNEASDTILYPTFGVLVRVRNVNIVGIWSSIKDELMPDIEANADIPEGIWYEFRRGGDEDDKKIWGYTSAYMFTRITSNKDDTIEIDKGSVIMMPIKDREFITLSDIKCERIAADGTKTEFEKEDETMVVSGNGKGRINFNMREFYAVSGLSLKGTWTTMSPQVEPPAIGKGSFKVRDEDGDAFDPPKDAKWIEFNASKGTFVWTEMLEEPDGILVMTGNFRTFGKDLLILTEIKGSFYARPGSSAESFENRDYMYGEKIYQVRQEVDDAKNPISLDIESIGKFKPVEQAD